MKWKILIFFNFLSAIFQFFLFKNLNWNGKLQKIRTSTTFATCIWYCHWSKFMSTAVEKERTTPGICKWLTDYGTENGVFFEIKEKIKNFLPNKFLHIRILFLTHSLSLSKNCLNENNSLLLFLLVLTGIHRLHYYQNELEKWNFNL